MGKDMSILAPIEHKKRVIKLLGGKLDRRTRPQITTRKYESSMYVQVTGYVYYHIKQRFQTKNVALGPLMRPEGFKNGPQK